MMGQPSPRPPLKGPIIHEIADELGNSDQASRGAPTSIQVQPATKAREDYGSALKHRERPRTPEPVSLCWECQLRLRSSRSRSEATAACTAASPPLNPLSVSRGLIAGSLAPPCAGSGGSGSRARPHG